MPGSSSRLKATNVMVRMAIPSAKSKNYRFWDAKMADEELIEAVGGGKFNDDDVPDCRRRYSVHGSEAIETPRR